MLNPGVLYMLISVVLFAVAVVVHFHSKHLSLSISAVISILTATLPVAAFINAYIYPSLLRSAQHEADRSRASSRFYKIGAVFLQALQGLVTVVLATLFVEGIVPTTGLDCILERDWENMYRAKDGDAIKYVQDTYSCCGMDSVDDRAFPFPEMGLGTCTELSKRTISCKKPWKQAMQSTAAVDLAVVLTVGLLQIVGLLLMRQGTNWWTASRTDGWKWFMTQRELSRPLLSAPEYEDSINNDEAPRRGYGTASPDTGSTNQREQS